MHKLELSIFRIHLLHMCLIQCFTSFQCFNQSVIITIYQHLIKCLLLWFMCSPVAEL